MHFYLHCYLISTITRWGRCYFPLFQMRKQRTREIKSFTLNHSWRESEAGWTQSSSDSKAQSCSWPWRHSAFRRGQREVGVIWNIILHEQSLWEDLTSACAGKLIKTVEEISQTIEVGGKKRGGGREITPFPPLVLMSETSVPKHSFKN